MSDWQVGDLAIYVGGGCGGHSKRDGDGVLANGASYRVSGIRYGPFSPIPGHACRAWCGLRLFELPDHQRGFCCESFRKILPDKHEDCEPEFVELLQRIKRPEKVE